MSGITELPEQQIQQTCPDFCERTNHENMHTPESPVIIHSTGFHNVHGVVMQISTGTTRSRYADQHRDRRQG